MSDKIVGELDDGKVNIAGGSAGAEVKLEDEPSKRGNSDESCDEASEDNAGAGVSSCFQESVGVSQAVDDGDDYKDPKKNILKKKREDPYTESVSEDDLPEDVKMETEAISDEELRTGGISGAETVSDDDFPPTQKRFKASKMKSKTLKTKKFDFKLIDWDEILERVNESESLPELDKYWKVVREDPSDFTGWTYLLQYVDQENDIVAARDAYNSFLSMYPYCYGYWRKYADYEKRKGDSTKCDAVFKRGLKAIPMSVDLWAHYLTHCKTTLKDDEDLLREQFEQAIDKCGLEFRSDRLWTLYIQWETENRRYQKVLGIYDRLLETPIQNLKTHFEDLQDLINRHRPSKILSVDEFFIVRSYVVGKLKSRNVVDTTSNPPGEGEDAGSSCTDEETVYMRERMVALRYKTYKRTMSKVADRWQFETSIKRPYFHIKPLEKSQLENWTKYLDFEIISGDFPRTMVLFERAMIACAMYQKFWLKYIRYLEQCGCEANLIHNVYKRACLVHLPKNAHLLLNWACFEEQNGNIDLARRIYIHAAEVSSNLLLVQLRHIHFERRCGTVAKVEELFQRYIAHSTQKCVILALVAKYAQFCQGCLKDTEKAKEILKDALHKYPEDPKLHFLLLDFVRSESSGFDDKCIAVFDSVLKNRAIALETKLQFAQMKFEYYHDFGTNPTDMISAQRDYLNVHQSYRELQVEKYKNEYKTDGMYYYTKRQ